VLVNFPTAMVAYLDTGNSVIASSIKKSLRESHPDVEYKLSRKIRTFLEKVSRDQILPFELNEMDQFIADYLGMMVSAEFEQKKRDRWRYDPSEQTSLRLFSDWALGEFGFVDLSETNVEYFPRAKGIPKPNTSTKRNKTPQMIRLFPQGKHEILSRIHRLVDPLSCRVCEVEKGFELVIPGGASYLAEDGRYQRAFVLNPEDPVIGPDINFRPLDVMTSDENDLVLKTTSVELSMQIHAASAKGYWLVLEFSKGQYITFEIPDITEGGRTSPIRLSLHRSFLEPYIKNGSFPAVNLEENVVEELCAKYWWFNTQDMGQIIKLINRSKTA